MSRKSRPHRGEPGNHQEGVLMKPRGEMTDPLVAVGQQFLDVLKAIEELANALREGAPDQPVHGAILLQQFFEIAEQIAATVPSTATGAFTQVQFLRSLLVYPGSEDEQPRLRRLVEQTLVNLGEGLQSMGERRMVKSIMLSRAAVVFGVALSLLAMLAILVVRHAVFP
jgi:hypothetical protein